jgi:hypothetical protein
MSLSWAFAVGPLRNRHNGGRGGASERGTATKELYVIAKDQPGEMNKIAEALGKNGVNMLALCAYNIDGTGRIHFVVNDHDKGKATLKKLGYRVQEDEVLILELKHSPGELARITGLLAKAGVNIDLIYGSGSTYPSAQMVMKVSDLKQAEKTLGLE